MHRDTPQAFARDPVALAYAKQCVAGDAAARLNPIQRVFAYLPFEHSEDLADQQRSVALYESLAESAAPNAEEAKLFNGYLEFARNTMRSSNASATSHRNRILGRPSSDEERAFLEQPGSSF